MGLSGKLEKIGSLIENNQTSVDFTIYQGNIYIGASLTAMTLAL